MSAGIILFCPFLLSLLPNGIAVAVAVVVAACFGHCINIHRTLNSWLRYLFVVTCNSAFTWWGQTLYHVIVADKSIMWMSPFGRYVGSEKSVWFQPFSILCLVPEKSHLKQHRKPSLTLVLQRNTLPWIGRVGLYKAYVTVCYKMHMVGQMF